VHERTIHLVTDDDPAPTTVRDRLTAAGLSESRIQEHMTAGRVRVDGELLDDLDQIVPMPARILLSSE
jgi:hypothetical protein